MSHRTPVRAPSGEEGRPQRRREACNLLTEARKDAGLTMLALSADVGCSQQAIQRAEDESDTGHPVHLDMLLAPLVVKQAVRAMARHAGMVAIELPTHAATGDVLVELSHAAKEHGDVVGAALAAASDGRIDPVEAAGLLTEIDEWVESVLKLRAVVEQAASVNVRAIGVRK